MYIEPPTADPRGDEALTWAVTCFDGSIAVVHHRLADLFLLAPDLFLEYVAHPPSRAFHIGRRLGEESTQRRIDRTGRQHVVLRNGRALGSTLLRRHRPPPAQVRQVASRLPVG